jgi:hypothetical protein
MSNGRTAEKLRDFIAHRPEKSVVLGGLANSIVCGCLQSVSAKISSNCADIRS